MNRRGFLKRLGATVAVAPFAVEFLKTMELPPKAAPYKLGTRARDRQGNEYVYVEVPVAAKAGTIVNLDSAANTRLGVSTTDLRANEAGWVMVYGITSMAFVSHPYRLNGEVFGVMYM